MVEHRDHSVNWTPERFSRFKNHFNQAEKSCQGGFTFEGYDYKLDYARHLVSYLESRLGNGGSVVERRPDGTPET